MKSLSKEAAASALVEALELRILPGIGVSAPEYLRLRNSARAGMLSILRDSLERPVGYVAWAMINRASLERLLRTGRLPSYPYEWKEGGFCLIVDVVIARHGRFDALRGVRKFVRSRRAIVNARESGRVSVWLRRGGRYRIWIGHRGGRAAVAARAAAEPNCASSAQCEG